MRYPTVQDFMTRDVVSLRPDAGFKDVVRTLAGRGVSGAPVVDEENRVIGVVSAADILHKEEFTTVAEAPRRHFESRRARAARAKAAADSACELMSSPALTVALDTPLARAARLMAERRVRRLPVVRADGTLAGIISRADVMSVFLTSDEELRELIVTEVVQRSMWADPAQVHVAVTDGVVMLSGELELKTLIPIIVELTRGIDGVVDVVDNLTYAVDNTLPERQSHWR